MKHTLLVTDLNFWKADIGSRQRILSLVEYLYGTKQIDLKILYLGYLSKEDKKLLKKFHLESTVDSLQALDINPCEYQYTYPTPTPHLEHFYDHKLKTFFIHYLASFNFDTIVVEYIKLDYLVNDIHGTYITVLDTHDLMSSRTQSYKKHKELPSISLDTLEQEVQIVQKYSYISLIQKNEFNTLASQIDISKLLLIPHAIDIDYLYKNSKKVNSIVFVSGPANLDHIVWFIQNIWCLFEVEKIKLNIYGGVCRALKELNIKTKNCTLHGRVEDLKQIYEDADVIINPVLFGSGLKIKNVEALSFGLPLLTTIEGANGIEDGIGESFLVANTKDEWVEKLLSLIISPVLRKKLSKNGFLYAQKNFSKQKCYEPLQKVLL